MAHHPDEQATWKDADNLLPSPFSGACASVRQNDGTEWIFYYTCESTISYQKIFPNGTSYRCPIKINNSTLVVCGQNNSLAAVLFQNSPQVFFIDKYFILREVSLNGTTGDSWVDTAFINSQNWPVYVNSCLTAVGDVGGNLPTQPEPVLVRVLFYETAYFPRVTAATYTAYGGWAKAVLPQ